ncbi:transporter substrate-binding domain-containing protein [Motilimonas sp. E26]|uniref:substrate-binding periplasmic protein n=1 Tax=Motilimonas sp. E26 TaxID=2865674 RepID=UPI001E542ED6|nr:transporter substrate-binding domain-containing protein [Motilimonas sp. E26]MCE0558890.1 transporter substrate-binding domain-containing protein [Motilimonas sp. E26]
MKWFLILVSLLLWQVQTQAQACEITMGYRTTARMPNINAKPNNAGLYFDLYTAAANKIGCELKVVRSPKNRILRGIADGSIDFYPGLTFTKERSKDIFFYDNGIPAADVGLTRKGEPKIKSYDDLQEKIILAALGSPGPQSTMYKLQFKRPPELTFDRVIDLILAKQADFYMDDFGTLYYYLIQHPRQSDLMLHMNCCGGITRLKLGFSKNSPHFKAVSNLSYDPALPLGVDNYPIKLDEESIAYKFHMALLALEEDGFTNTLYKDYYGASLQDLMNED